ncbi:Sec-independent protein translocase protein TatAd [Paenibacillus baekrokdamisoli]|uniref:Sec-independent protein translocase protein TatA n=1 Tax=Paenibacillus baekrokdamisoli TaxID=1712516 RepID=A0A3G9JK89_9BACL|nr:twin-arginine translocase TatA/TatE family subunit [Paenibacillus baekrokdamisoli]MBB3071429.1 sec-independent protein translocase protein TatA [Paenibacillus baekrokdamisoli]BBH24538.1 Sec-independent protein translocase protein TatAd [Paenibacillus baekrokdamisoli]
MFNGIGVTGFILLALIALLLFGPNKLPELGRAFGRTLKEFKAGARDMMDDNDDRKEVSRTEVIRKTDAEADNKRLPE